jgi:hypothetical protein
MPQFNGKQERVKAKQPPDCWRFLLLTCAAPATVKRTDVFWSFTARSRIQLSSLATERLEQAHGKAMKAASSARIPANKVVVRLFFKRSAVTLMHWRGCR